MRWRVVALLMIGALSLGACEENSGPPSGTAIQIERLSFVLPAGWQQVAPSSNMRAAQAAIPGPGGAAEMAVFHFGTGQGGDVEANLQRWLNQVVPEAGNTPHRETFESGDLRVTFVDVYGTLKPGQMGMGPDAPQPDSRLLGAVIEGDGGPWFFKAIGAEETLAPQRDAFVAMLRTARRRG